MAWNEPGPGRDPWNGPSGNKGGGPPDLETLLKQWLARLRGVKAPKSPPGGVSRKILLSAIVLLAVIWLGSGFSAVDEQERGVVLRFGVDVGEVGPGIHWHLPWPIEQIKRVNFTGVRSISDHAILLTQDQNLVEIDLTVQYHVSSASDFLFQVKDPDAILRQSARSALGQVIGRTPMDVVLGEGRQAVADAIRQALQEPLDQYHAGLTVSSVNLQEAQPPDAVQDAFADAIKAREDQVRLKNDADAYAGERLPRARSGAARQLTEAESYRDQAVARAEGDVARFAGMLDQYHRAPQITRERLYFDTVSAVLSHSSKILIDVDKSSPVLNLPLAELLHGGSAATTASPASSEDAAVQPPLRAAEPVTATPGTLRSRDRGSY